MGSLAADIIREATDEHMGGAASLWPDVFTHPTTTRNTNGFTVTTHHTRS